MQDDDADAADEPVSSTEVTLGKDGKPVLSAEEVERRAKKKAAKDAHEKKVAEEKARIREARVVKLIERLKNQLALFTEQATDEDDVQTAAGGASSSSRGHGKRGRGARTRADVPLL